MNEIENNSNDLQLKRIRREIEQFLDSPLRDEEWKMLEDDTYIAMILASRITIRNVAERVAYRRKVYEVRTNKISQSASEQIKQESSGRLRALSVLIAQEVSKDNEVQDFRSKVLSNNLLISSQVEAWINKQDQADGTPSWWLTIPVDPTFQQDEIEYQHSSFVAPLKLEIPNFRVINWFELRFLFYEAAGEPDVKKIPTNHHEVLDDLRLLSERLSREHGWTEAQATTFVLTGEAPLISAITYNLKERELPSLTRIVLEIDPTLSPKEVGEYYRKIRQEVLGARHRDMTNKHLQLAIFAAARPDGETWAKRMDEWNKSQSDDWEYEDSVQFAHDCILARKRLLGIE